MAGHAVQRVARYCELANCTPASLKKVTTPCFDDHVFTDNEFQVEGKLSDVAARIVLKCLYLARIGRPDLLWSVNILARQVTKWTKACDRRLERLIAYIHHSQDWTHHNYVGDPPEHCFLALFQDASFAGDTQDSKSTSGGLLCLVGPKTFVTLAWMCKKQTAISHSSAEAEIISLDAGLRMEGIPAMVLWDQIMEVLAPQSVRARPLKERAPRTALESMFDVDSVPPTYPLSSGAIKMVIFEDNESVIKMVVKGRSLAMGHVSRTHRVDLDWLYERCRVDPSIRIRFVPTKSQLADLLTKGSFTAAAWKEQCKLWEIGSAGIPEKVIRPTTGTAQSSLPERGSKPKATSSPLPERGSRLNSSSSSLPEKGSKSKRVPKTGGIMKTSSAAGSSAVCVCLGARFFGCVFEPETVFCKVFGGKRISSWYQRACF